MSLLTTGGPTSPQFCERYADEIAMLDEPGPETSDRIAAGAHLAECQRCQREWQAQLATSAALRGRVQTLMAQAPTFTEAEIAARSALQTREGAAMRQERRRREVANDWRRREAQPTMGKPQAPSRAAPPPSFWRRVLSMGGSVAAIALVTALLVATLTGHLFGRGSSARHRVVTPATTAVPLSALKVYAPNHQIPGDPPSLTAFRASDGAPENAASAPPVKGWGSVIAQGVYYELTMPNANVSDPNATIPAIFSATRVRDGQTLWSERIDPIYTPDLVLVNGVLYLATKLGVVGVDTRIMAVYAFRASDGARLWRIPLMAQPDGPPVVSNGVVYVVAGATVFALRAGDGGILWRTTLRTGGQRIISAWPAVTNGALYIYVSLESPTGQKDGFGAEAFALRLTDGEPIWRVELGTDVFPADGPFPPVVADGVVYVRLASMKFTSPVITMRLFALRATDGVTLWRYTSTRVETGSSGVPNIYPPSVSNGVVYVTEDGGNLTALSASDGHTIWRVNVDTSPEYDTFPFSITSPLAIDGAVFVLVNSQVVAVRASDGGTLWRASCGMPDASMNYQPYQLVVEP